MRSNGKEANEPANVALSVLAGALFAADFCAVKQLTDAKSKLRLALEGGVPDLIRRESARVALDPDALPEADRAAYEAIRLEVAEKYGDQIRTSPFEVPAALVEELADRALAAGSYASASAALEYLGIRNKRVGELVAAALRDLKPQALSRDGEPGPAGHSPAMRAAVKAFWVAAKLKNPLEPLFQKRAIDLHFSSPGAKEKLFGALLAEGSKEAVDLAIDYLLGDPEISRPVRDALPGGTSRRAFLKALAELHSGGEEKYAEFVSRYGASVGVFKSGKEKPDLAAVQKALTGGASESPDGIGLLRALAVAHPVSSLVCRVIPLPRGGHYLIPTIVEGRSALDILGIA